MPVIEDYMNSPICMWSISGCWRCLEFCSWEKDSKMEGPQLQQYRGCPGLLALPHPSCGTLVKSHSLSKHQFLHNPAITRVYIFQIGRESKWDTASKELCVAKQAPGHCGNSGGQPGTLLVLYWLCGSELSCYQVWEITGRWMLRGDLKNISEYSIGSDYHGKYW